MKSFYKEGWRPFIGWICGFSLIFQFILYPLIKIILKLFGVELDPMQDIGMLMDLVLAMLGLSGMRTYEKSKGIE